MVSLLLLVNIVIAACIGAVNVEAVPKVLGYYSGDMSMNSIDKYSNEIDIISLDFFNSNMNGKIVGEADVDVINKAKSKSIELYFVVGNYGRGGFDPKIAHSVLTKKNIRTRFIQGALDLVNNNGFDGVNIDFEAVPKKDRAAYTSFITTLATELHNIGKKVAVSIPAAQEDNPKNSWIGAYDYEALGNIVDVVQVMTYDQHGPWGEPGPVSGLDWVKKCIAYAKSVIPVEKISMGMNAYGYYWNLDKKTGNSFSWIQFNQLIHDLDASVQFDNKTSSPYFYYKKKGDDFVAWIENEQSIKLKAQFANETGVGSVSIWALRFEDQSYYDAIAQGFAT